MRTGRGDRFPTRGTLRALFYIITAAWVRCNRRTLEARNVKSGRFGALLFIFFGTPTTMAGASRGLSPPFVKASQLMAIWSQRTADAPNELRFGL